MSNFRKALMFTAIPIVLLWPISIGLTLTDYDRLLGERIGYGAPGLLVIAIVAAIVFNIRYKNKQQRGYGGELVLDLLQG